MNKFNGRSLIGFQTATHQGKTFQATNPATGEALPGDFGAASAEEVAQACELAAKASREYRKTSAAQRADFLRRIATEIESVSEILTPRVVAETALPTGRVVGETGRTLSQLRLFAQVLEEGSWVEARIDRAQPNRQPVPAPDVRSMHRPLGPVAVFCASNFPLAFSVAGGDTAAALAAGCPVIVKAHHAHPGTAEIVGQAVVRAARACGLPSGVFSLLFGSGREVGEALVRHPAIRAVGFTGSRTGGEALMKIAAARPRPIPVYAEMSSVNPLILLPGAAASRVEELAKGLHASAMLGVGQFCTNPGLVFVPKEARGLMDRLAELYGQTASNPMLHAGIKEAYEKAVEHKLSAKGVKLLARALAGSGIAHGRAALLLVALKDFVSQPALAEEMFGPATLLIEYSSVSELEKALQGLEGQLTATVHGTPGELAGHDVLLAALEEISGRLLFNGYPTGVEVCPAMVHGGPYPATSDGRSTSVGPSSIYRFTRRVCYQGFPDEARPLELRDEGHPKIMRLVDGNFLRD